MSQAYLKIIYRVHVSRELNSLDVTGSVREPSTSMFKYYKQDFKDFPFSVIQHICRNTWQKEQQYFKSIICFVKDTLQLSQENVFRGEMSREVLQ